MSCFWMPAALAGSETSFTAIRHFVPSLTVVMRMPSFEKASGLPSTAAATMREARVAGIAKAIWLQESSLDGLQKRIDVTDAAEGHRGTPAHRIPDRKHFAPDDRRLGGKGGGKIEHQPVFLVYAVDDDVQVGAFPNDLGDELMQIGGQDMNDLRHDVPRRAVFLDGVSRRDNVTVMQMKAGSADLDFSGLVRSAGILSVFQDADGGPLRALNHIRWRPCLCGRTWRGTCQDGDET